MLNIFIKGARKEITEVKLVKSPRFSTTENENVKGSILLFGVRDEYIEKISEKMVPQEYRLDATDRKLEKASEVYRRRDRNDQKRLRVCLIGQ